MGRAWLEREGQGWASPVQRKGTVSFRFWPDAASTMWTALDSPSSVLPAGLWHMPHLWFHSEAPFWGQCIQPAKDVLSNPCKVTLQHRISSQKDFYHYNIGGKCKDLLLKWDGEIKLDIYPLLSFTDRIDMRCAGTVDGIKFLEYISLYLRGLGHFNPFKCINQNPGVWTDT